MFLFVVMPHTAPFQTIPNALRAGKQGKLVIVVDDARRENEGDLQIPAAKASARIINFMIAQARGLVCVALPEERLRVLHLPPMVAENTDPYHTDFTVSVNARFGVTTGISAYDRARTIQVLIDPKTKPTDLVRPGHIFPLRARPGGVLERAGHTEAAMDLARLAGYVPAGVTCEIIHQSGRMARLPQLILFARAHKIGIITIADLIAFRRRTEGSVKIVATASLPIAGHIWQMVVFASPLDAQQHLALIKGDIAGKKNVLVRVHSECVTGDLFGSQRCDCGEQLDAALQRITKQGEGVLVYLRQEGRGIGLINKLHAYALQDAGIDTVEANRHLGFPPDVREYGIAAQILNELGLSSIHLLTNNPKKIVGLEGFGLRVTQHVPLQTRPTPRNRSYLKTKQKKLGHILDL